MNTIIKTSVATIKKIHDHLIEVDYNNEYDVELKDAKEVHQAFLMLCNNKPFTILIEGRGKFINFSDDAKKFYANDESLKHLKVALAMVINSLPARIIARFYSTFYKPYYKTKIFSTKESAINWLEESYNEFTSEQTSN